MLPNMVTLTNGQGAPWKLRIPHMEGRSFSAACPRLQECETDSEMGLGKSATYGGQGEPEIVATH